jgi:hypothetical protein
MQSETQSKPAEGKYRNWAAYSVYLIFRSSNKIAVQGKKQDVQWVNSTTRNTRVSVLVYANINAILTSLSNNCRQQQNLCDAGLAYGKRIFTAKAKSTTMKKSKYYITIQ